MSILTKTFHGAAWSAAGHGLQTLLTLISVAVIASHLEPELYGLFGAAMLIVSIAEILTAGSLTQFLIQREQIDESHRDTCFWLNNLVAVGVAVTLWLGTEPFLAWMNAEAARHAYWCLILMLLINALAAVPQSLLIRDLQLRQSSTAGMTANSIAAVVGIGLAIYGAGFWALVGMELSRATIRNILLWRACQWRPGMTLAGEKVQEMAQFNIGVLATQSLGRIDLLLPRAIIGAMLGPAALGIWILAKRVSQEIGTVSTVALNSVAMASIARSSNDRAQAHRIIQGLYQTSSLVGLPMYIGMIAIAPVMVPTVFGAAWIDAVIPMQILLLTGIRTCTGAFNISILRAMDQHAMPVILLMLGVLIGLILMPAMTVWGLTGVAVAWLARNLLTWPLAIRFISRATGLSAARQMNPVAGPLTCAALMGIAVALLVSPVVAATGPVTALGILVALGALIYLALLWRLMPEQSRQILGLLDALKSRDKARLAHLLEAGHSVSEVPR